MAAEMQEKPKHTDCARCVSQKKTICCLTPLLCKEARFCTMHYIIVVNVIRTGEDPGTRHEKDRKEQLLAPTKTSLQKPSVNGGETDTKWGLFQWDRYAVPWEV